MSKHTDTSSHAISQAADPDLISEFVARVLSEGARLYRDLPWRDTHDPYEVLVSEVMLQQTQVVRAIRFYERWLDQFPTLEALAAAPLEAVLRAWEGMGYHRRAIALKRAAEAIVASTRPGSAAQVPQGREALLALPGVGPATTAGVRAFAYGEHDAYLETNVRAVFLHELFEGREGVSDREILELLHASIEEAERQDASPRQWNYALLDYGAHLKRTMPNPSRRSKHHARQSKFEGSVRQKRAKLLRAVIRQPGAPFRFYFEEIAQSELDAGRPAPDERTVLDVLEALVGEGFLASDGETWWVG